MSLIDSVRVKLREETNRFFGSARRKKIGGQPMTIISNNCWGGHVYRYYQLPYDSPTIGCYFYASDYVRFCQRLKEYLDMELQFIPVKESAHADSIMKKNEHCPIGKLGDGWKVAEL